MLTAQYDRQNSVFKYGCQPSKEMCKKSGLLFSSALYGFCAVPDVASKRSVS